MILNKAEQKTGKSGSLFRHCFLATNFLKRNQKPNNICSKNPKFEIKTREQQAPKSLIETLAAKSLRRETLVLGRCRFMTTTSRRGCACTT
ncbi:hypothetical protein VIGAN_06185700 [Vigna angularis var. angularis]|uniref:Uncharacterized protein n=1 Tax=Vigna angularis var. angularis TaxID=157739 RepID=A0A0S3SCQ0_PHAAN|nr:hypothetical protein VIGAN_06185700 [Vigna angularis var. angularis]